MGQMIIDRICCITDLTLIDTTDNDSIDSNISLKSDKKTKKTQEKSNPNIFRTSLSESFTNKNIPLSTFYKRASIIAPSSEIILNNPNNKLFIKKLSNLPIGLGTIIRKNNNKPDDNYIISKSLGEGGYGNVVKVIHKHTGQVRAMKIIPKNNLQPGYTEQEIFREINILKQLEHPYIMKLYEFYSDDEFFYLINEFCNEGDLSEKLQKVGRFDEKLVKMLMFQIFSAVLYLHSNNVIHGDLKLENVMVDNISYEDEKKKIDNERSSLNKRLSFISSYKIDIQNIKNVLNEDEINHNKYEHIKNFEIKLIDFGAAKIFTKYKKQFDDTVGTLVYCSPEVLKNNYDSKCDIWSCGVIMYILLSGEIPFAGENENEIMKSIMNKKVSFDSSFFNDVSDEAKDLIIKCLVYHKSKRLNAKEALNHPFFKIDIDFNNFFFDEDLTVDINQILIRMKNFSSESKFHQAILVYLAYNYAEKRLTQKLKHIFFYINKSMDGKIKPKELLNVYQENKMRITKDEVIKIIKSIDFNNSGAIEYEEFIRIAIPKEDLFTDVNLKEAFDLFDINKKGIITINDMKEVLGMNKDVDENVVLKFMKDIGYKSMNYLQFRSLVLGGFE